jgi:hypothetical protein
MSLYLITIGIIFALLLAGIGIERLYRAFAARHPQLGPFRKNGGGCGSCAAESSCSQDKTCPPKN